MHPALLLFTPREAAKPVRRVMNMQEVQNCFGALDQRERLIAKLSVIAGMRPGEIFAFNLGPTDRDVCGHPATGLSRSYRHAEDGPVGS